MFDDLIRRTAAGTIVPVQFRVGGTTHRFWVTDTDRDRLEDLRSDDTQLPPVPAPGAPARASRNRPTCKPSVSAPNAPAPVPARPASPAAETAPAPSEAGAQTDAAPSHPPLHRNGLPDELVTLQQAADDAHLQLQRLEEPEERDRQRRAWREAAAAVQDAVAQYAKAQGLNRYEVEKRLRHAVRHP